MNIVLLAALLVGISDTCSTNLEIRVGDYAAAVRLSGNTPVVLCRTADPRDLERVVEKLDLLILPGGEDVAPALYGAKPSPRLGAVNHVRDSFERSVLAIAVRHGVPIFGTCRGLQMINVFFGGTLWQDIPSEFPLETSESHSYRALNAARQGSSPSLTNRDHIHTISILPGSRLAEACGVTNASINSSHHQAVKGLAPGFKVTATSPGGVVEAIECEWYPAAGVQFHPEVLFSWNGDPVWKRFYSRLTAFAGPRRVVSEKSMPIGVFDSGIGGMSVLEKLLVQDRFDNDTGAPRPDGRPDFENERFVYFGDQANMPYGRYDAAGKADFLRELVVRDAQFLLGGPMHSPAKAVVIACNTATAYGYGKVAAMARPGDAPVVGVVNAGVAGAIEATAGEKGPYAIGVIATPATIASGVYERTLAKALAESGRCGVEVASRGGIGLAEAVEHSAPDMCECARTNIVALVEDYRTRGGKAPIKAVILGCTHYPFVLDVFKSALAGLAEDPRFSSLVSKDVVFVDPAENTAAESYRELRKRGLLRPQGEAIGGRRTEAFISVGVDGPLTDAVKYGRDTGSRTQLTRIELMTPGNMPSGAPALLRKMTPEVAKELGF